MYKRQYTTLTIPPRCFFIHDSAFVGSSIKSNSTGRTVTVQNGAYPVSKFQTIFGTGTTRNVAAPVNTSTFYAYPSIGSEVFTEQDYHDQFPNGGFTGFSGLTVHPVIILDDSITEIGANGFYNNYSINNSNFSYLGDALHLGSNTTIIGDNAFRIQPYLKTILIKKPLVSIGHSAFYGCTSFKGASFKITGGSLDQDYSSSVYNLLPYNNTNYKKIEDYTFYNNSAHRSSRYADQETIVDNLTLVSDSVTYYLESTKIPTQVTEIGHSAFYQWSFNMFIFTHFHGSDYSDSSHYSDIKVGYDGNSVSIGSQYVNNISLNKIGVSAFYSQGNLKHVLVGPHLAEIGVDAFKNCNNLETFSYTSPAAGVVQINQPVTTTLGANAFQNSNAMTTVRFFGTSLISSLEAAFPDTTISKIEANYLHTSNTSVGPDLTGGNLTFDISFQTGVTTIDSAAYQSEQKLTKLVFPAQIVSIGQNAFNNCDNLTKLVFPAETVSIGQNAFNNCNNLTEIDFRNSTASVNGPTAATPFLGTGAFTDGALSGITYHFPNPNNFHPDFINNIYFTSGLTDTIDVPSDNDTTLVSSDISSKLYQGWTFIINIKDTVQNINIDSSAFFYDDNGTPTQFDIKDIKFPSTLIQVSSNAFKDVRVTNPSDKVIVTGSATNPVGDYSFYNTNVVKVVDLSGSTGTWDLSGSTFAGHLHTTDLSNDIVVYLPKFDSSKTFKDTFYYNNGSIYLHPEDNNAHTFIDDNRIATRPGKNLISNVVINSGLNLSNNSYILKYILRNVPTANPISYIANGYIIPNNVGAIIHFGAHTSGTRYDYIQTIQVTSSITSGELNKMIELNHSYQSGFTIQDIKLYPGYKMYVYGFYDTTAINNSTINVLNNETTITFSTAAMGYTGEIRPSLILDNTDGTFVQNNYLNISNFVSNHNYSNPLRIDTDRNPGLWTFLLFFENKLVYRNSL